MPRYCLTENISFNPNPRVFGGNGMPWPDQLSDAVPGPGNDGYPTGKYDSRAYQLGFFAAIQVTAAGDDAGVDIDLQGFKLEQSAEHALAQRFFALIELASAPFHYDHGPHNFTTDVQLKSAEKVVELAQPGSRARDWWGVIRGLVNVLTPSRPRATTASALSP